MSLAALSSPALVTFESSESSASERRRDEAPAVQRRIRVGMPHMDAGGLSENWLLRHSGDLHWEAITRRLGVASHEIRAEGRQRLYPTVIALRGRYSAPLSAVRENDVLSVSVEVDPCGGACAHGRIAALVGERRFAVELLTTFAHRQDDGTLHMALPAARLASRWTPPGPPPALAQLARAARQGEPIDDNFSGPSLTPVPARPPLGSLTYEPSPYADFNGAGLLYFASYATISDTAEHRLVRSLGLGPTAIRDWATGTSTVKRDLFFYGNLPLGETLSVELLALEVEPAGTVKTRARLRRERDGIAIADVVTRRLLLSRRS